MTAPLRDEVSTAVLATARDLAAGESLRLVVRGHSMEPRLTAGTLVRVRSRRIYWPGDVIAFLAAGRLVIHRVLGYRPGPGASLAYIVQGDNTSTADQPISPREVIGRVVAAGGTDEAIAVTWRERSMAMARFTRLVWRRLLPFQPRSC